MHAPQPVIELKCFKLDVVQLREKTLLCNKTEATQNPLTMHLQLVIALFDTTVMVSTMSLV